MQQLSVQDLEMVYSHSFNNHCNVVMMFLAGHKNTGPDIICIYSHHWPTTALSIIDFRYPELSVSVQLFYLHYFFLYNLGQFLMDNDMKGK
jgi:hypothetical protein